MDKGCGAPARDITRVNERIEWFTAWSICTHYPPCLQGCGQWVDVCGHRRELWRSLATVGGGSNAGAHGRAVDRGRAWQLHECTDQHGHPKQPTVGIKRRAARGGKVGGEKMVARFQIRDEGARGGGGGVSTRIYKAAPRAVLIGSDNYSGQRR